MITNDIEEAIGHCETATRKGLIVLFRLAWVSGDVIVTNATAEQAQAVVKAWEGEACAGNS